MANVQSSPEVIRQIKSDLNTTTKELADAAKKISSALSSSSEWNDAQGNHYRELMRRIARLIESPVGTLQAAQPKLEKLAQALDAYNRVKF